MAKEGYITRYSIKEFIIKKKNGFHTNQPTSQLYKQTLDIGNQNINSVLFTFQSEHFWPMTGIETPNPIKKHDEL